MGTTKETKLKMKERDQAREKARLSKNEQDWIHFRQQCVTENKNDKKKYFKKLYKKCQSESSTKNLYKVVQGQLGYKTGGPPQTFLLGGNHLPAPKQMANMQIECFQDKVDKLIRELPPTNKNPLETLEQSFKNWGDLANNHLTFEIKPITTLETLELIKQLGNSTSFSYDKIDAQSLKLAIEELYIPINHLINLSLKQSKFGNTWKIARVIPLHKGKGTSRLDPQNYHPISLLSPIAKITEKVVQQQLLKFMESTGQLNSNHHAYRSNHSTTSAVLQMSDSILQATDQNLITTLVTVDKSVAFDCVKHSIQEKKLEMYKVGTQARKWIMDYLGHRDTPI